MASFRDELRTVLAIDGLSNYLNGLRQAQQGNLAAALQVNQLKDSLSGIGRLLIRVGDALGIQAGQWAIVATAIYGARTAIHHIRETIREATEAFEKYNVVLFRTSFLFGSMGTPTSMSRLQGFARERGAQTGIPEEDTLALLGRARQSGFGPQTISRLVPLAQDYQASGRGSAQSLIDMLNTLMHQEGRGRGSLGAINSVATQLGLDPRYFTGGQQHDLQEVMRQLSQKVGGLSEAMAHTVSGTFERNQELLRGAMIRLGGVIESALVPTMEVLNRSLLGIQRIIDIGTNPEGRAGKIIHDIDELQRHMPGVTGLPLVGTLRRLQDQESLTPKDKNAEHDSRRLDEISANTQSMASTLFASVFGSATAFTQQAASLRNLQFAVRSRS